MPVTTRTATTPLYVPEPAQTHITLLQAALYTAQVVKAADSDDCIEAGSGAMDALEAILIQGMGVHPVYCVCMNHRSPDYNPRTLWLNPQLFEPVTEILEFSERDRLVYQAMLATKEYQLRHLCDFS